ncbi:hypothetical protein [Thalassoglobus polymorphus]|uniref:Uncharacterized protein n=1 Tax=Thalassoglobus polymorphus TaxID=2527994 RepID=A0A517QKF4_9PLAN|nr:hypothetical protein [Thalassoglobus polymorphus]QDT32084.1 hypothetical protein Mal48_13250 [Thalassoglobus polymorphus]
MSETTTEDDDLQQVQERLMKMLESVRLDPDEPEERPQTNLQQRVRQSHSTLKTCPGCDSTEPWGGSSWCPKCGYYPKFGKKVVKRDAEEENEEEADLDTKTMLQMVPRWAYFLIGGLVALLVESVAVRVAFPAIQDRSPIAIFQIFIGVNVLGLAHMRAYMIASELNEDINFISIFWSPTVIWKTIFERMPEVRKTVMAGSWGLAAILYAILFVGLDYGNLFHPDYFKRNSSFNPLKWVVFVASSMASAQAEEAGSDGSPETSSAMADLIGTAVESAPAGPTAPVSDDIEDALVNFAGETGLNADGGPVNHGATGDPQPDTQTDLENPSTNGSLPSTGPVVVHTTAPVDKSKRFQKDYIVIGFFTNSAGDLRSLLLAEETEKSNRIRLIGKYLINTEDQSFVKELQTQLETFRIRRPVMQSRYIAKWTAPMIVCKIVHDGTTPDGRIINGQLVSFFDESKVLEFRSQQE